MTEHTMNTSIHAAFRRDIARLIEALEIRLINLNPSSLATESEVDFDNVRLTATIIPEPTALTHFGIAALAISRRPSRRSA